MMKAKPTVPPRMWAQGYRGLGEGRDIKSLYGATGTEQHQEGQKAGFEWNSSSFKKTSVLSALFLLYSNSFTFLLPSGSAELPVMMAQIMLGTNKGILALELLQA